MNQKKIAVIIGAILTSPGVIVAGALGAVPFYERFIFKGEMSDFAPGDAFGELLYTVVFALPFLILFFWGWRHLYRKVSKRSFELRQG